MHKNYHYHHIVLGKAQVSIYNILTLSKISSTNSNITVSQDFVPPKSTLYMHIEPGKRWLGTARPPSPSPIFRHGEPGKICLRTARPSSLSVQTPSASKNGQLNPSLSLSVLLLRCLTLCYYLLCTFSYSLSLTFLFLLIQADTKRQ